MGEESQGAAADPKQTHQQINDSAIRAMPTMTIPTEKNDITTIVSQN